jgi:hypothetical protein
VSIWAFSFVVGMQEQTNEGNAQMFDVLTSPVGVAAGRTLALSAMPDAPVVAAEPRRERRRLRGLAGRLVAPRRRLRVTRLEQE